MPLQERSDKLGWVHRYVMQRRNKVMEAEVTSNRE